MGEPLSIREAVAADYERLCALFAEVNVLHADTWGVLDEALSDPKLEPKDRLQSRARVLAAVAAVAEQTARP